MDRDFVLLVFLAILVVGLAILVFLQVLQLIYLRRTQRQNAERFNRAFQRALSTTDFFEKLRVEEFEQWKPGVTELTEARERALQIVGGQVYQYCMYLMDLHIEELPQQEFIELLRQEVAKLRFAWDNEDADDMGEEEAEQEG